MENFGNYRLKEINFIIIFYKILLVFLVSIIIILFTLSINDSVSFKSGEIGAAFPQIDYKSPFEATPLKTFVKEGDYVKKGDTLMIIISNQLGNEFSRFQNDFEVSNQKIDVTDQMIQNIDAKIDFLKKEKQLLHEKYFLDKAKNNRELESYIVKSSLGKEKLKIAHDKLLIDSSLYKKKIISLFDISNTYNNYLSSRESYLEVENKLNQIRSEKNDLGNNYLRELNNIEIKLVELNQSASDLIQKKMIIGNEIKNTERSLDYYKKEIEKQYIISDIDGGVINIYNSQQALNFVNKGELLVSVSPLKNKFHVKAIIHENDMKYVKSNQEVHLKLDAFYFFEHGILKGKVKYISERKTNNDFFVLIELQNELKKFDLKSGYTLKGEIIIEKLKLYKFILKKMFSKVNNTIS